MGFRLKTFTDQSVHGFSFLVTSEANRNVSKVLQKVDKYLHKVNIDKNVWDNSTVSHHTGLPPELILLIRRQFTY